MTSILRGMADLRDFGFGLGEGGIWRWGFRALLCMGVHAWSHAQELLGMLGILVDRQPRMLDACWSDGRFRSNHASTKRQTARTEPHKPPPL